MIRTILVFGDSLSWGRMPGSDQRHAVEHRWPYLMERALGRERFQVVVDAVPGRTTVFEEPFRPYRNGLAAIEPALIRSTPVDLVILGLGTNDLQELIGAQPEEIALGLEALIRRIRHFAYDPEQAPPPILILIPPRPVSAEGGIGVRFRSAREKWPGLRDCFLNRARTTGCAAFDLSTIVTSEEDDGLHLSRESNAAIAAALAGLVPTLLP